MSDSIQQRLQAIPIWARILCAAFLWLALISWAHRRLNFHQEGREVLRLGYMPVITNLASPLMDESSRGSHGVRYESLKFSSFAEMAEALRHGEIDAAFMIAPLAVVLHSQGEDVRVLYIGNRHESTLVVRRDLGIGSFRELAGHTVAVPMRFSGHNLAVRQLAEEYGLADGGLDIVEMNPPDMAAALATGALDAYFVGEPFAAQVVLSGDGEVLTYVEDIWPGFICNLMVVREDLVASRPQSAREMVQAAARAGLWTREHPAEAAEILSRYWNQPVDLVRYALETPADRIVYDRFLPREDELRYMAEEMQRFGLLERVDVRGLVDDRFAKQAILDRLTDVDSIVNVPSERDIAAEGGERNTRPEEQDLNPEARPAGESTESPS